MGRIFKRPDATSYFIEWFDPATGKWRRKSARTPDRKAAEAALRSIERRAHGAVGEGGVPEDQTAHALGDAVDALVQSALSLGKSASTFRMWVQKAGHLVRLLGRTCDVNKLTRDQLQAYVNTRFAEGAALSTISKEIITLRSALKHAADRKDADGRPLFRGSLAVLPKVKAKYTPRRRYLPVEEFARLLAELPPHRQLWVFVAVFMGGRYSEVARLDWADIKWAAPAHIHVRGTKTEASDRRVPLHPELAKWLWPLRRPTGAVVGAWGNVRRDLAEACTRAGLPAKVTPNDLRRTFASWLKQRGVDSAVVAMLLGHTSTRMVDLVYGKIDAATLARAVAALPGERAAGGLQEGALAAPDAPGANAPEPENVNDVDEVLVLGPGIEPGTRGFSITVFRDTNERFVKRFFEGGRGAGDRRAMASVTDTKPSPRLLKRGAQ